MKKTVLTVLLLAVVFAALIVSCTRVEASAGGAERTRSEQLVESGIAHEELGNYDAAIRDFNEAIRIWPENATAFANRGETNRLMGRLDAALSDFNEAIRLNPNSAFAFSGRGMVWAMLDQLDAALRDYNEAIRLDPNNADAFGSRGDVHSWMEQWALALIDYTEAIRLNPNAFTFYRRGEVNSHLELWDAALSDYTESIRLGDSRSDAWAFAGRGFVYWNLGQINQAIQDFERALALNPDIEWAREALENLRGY